MSRVTRERTGPVLGTKALPWAIGIGVASLVGGMVMAAFADDLGRPLTAQANGFSTSAIGHAAFIDLLGRLGVDVRVRRTDRMDMVDPGTPFVLMEPPAPREVRSPVDVGPLAESRSEKLEDLVERVLDAEQSLVIVLPKWFGVAKEEHPRWLETNTRAKPERLLSTLNELFEIDLELVEDAPSAVGTVETDWGASWKVELTDPQVLRPNEDLVPLLSHGSGYLAAEFVDDDGGHMIFVSDPDLLNNHGLGKGENAACSYDLFRYAMGDTGAVVFDETLHGFGLSTGILYELFRFPLVLGVLHAGLLVGLAVWAGQGRFGKPRPLLKELPSGKATLITNTASLLSLGGYLATSLPRYVEGVLRAVASHYHLPPTLSDEERVRRLQAVTAARGLDVDLPALIRQVNAVRVHPGKNETAMRLARRIHRWSEELFDVD